MLLKTLVKALVEHLLHGNDGSDILNINLINTLKRDIRQDAMEAFDRGRPLVERYASIYSTSNSYVDFLFKLCDVTPFSQQQNCVDVSSDLNKHNGQLKKCHKDLQQLKQENDDLQRDNDKLKAKLDDCRQEMTALQRQLDKLQDTLRRTQLQRDTSQERINSLQDEYDRFVKSSRKDHDQDLKNLTWQLKEQQSLHDECMREKSQVSRDRKYCLDSLNECQQENFRLKRDSMTLHKHPLPPEQPPEVTCSSNRYDYPDDRGGEKIKQYLENNIGRIVTVEKLEQVFNLKDLDKKFSDMKEAIIQSLPMANDWSQSMQRSSELLDSQREVLRNVESIRNKIYDIALEANRNITDTLTSTRFDLRNDAMSRIDRLELLLMSSNEKLGNLSQKLGKMSTLVRKFMKSVEENNRDYETEMDLKEEVDQYESSFSLEKKLGPPPEEFHQLYYDDEFEQKDLPQVPNDANVSFYCNPPKNLLNILRDIVPSFDYEQSTPVSWMDNLANHLKDYKKALDVQIQTLNQPFTHDRQYCIPSEKLLNVLRSMVPSFEFSPSHTAPTYWIESLAITLEAFKSRLDMQLEVLGQEFDRKLFNVDNFGEVLVSLIREQKVSSSKIRSSPYHIPKLTRSRSARRDDQEDDPYSLKQTKGDPESQVPGFQKENDLLDIYNKLKQEFDVYKEISSAEIGRLKREIELADLTKTELVQRNLEFQKVSTEKNAALKQVESLEETLNDEVQRLTQEKNQYIQLADSEKASLREQCNVQFQKVSTERNAALQQVESLKETLNDKLQRITQEKDQYIRLVDSEKASLLEQLQRVDADREDLSQQVEHLKTSLSEEKAANEPQNESNLKQTINELKKQLQDQRRENVGLRSQLDKPWVKTSVKSDEKIKKLQYLRKLPDKADCCPNCEESETILGNVHTQLANLKQDYNSCMSELDTCKLQLQERFSPAESKALAPTHGEYCENLETTLEALKSLFNMLYLNYFKTQTKMYVTPRKQMQVSREVALKKLELLQEIDPKADHLLQVLLKYVELDTEATFLGLSKKSLKIMDQNSGMVPYENITQVSFEHLKTFLNDTFDRTVSLVKSMVKNIEQRNPTFSLKEDVEDLPRKKQLQKHDDMDFEDDEKFFDIETIP